MVSYFILAADYHTFVDDTAARGYNAIELHVSTTIHEATIRLSMATAIDHSLTGSMGPPGMARSPTGTLTVKRPISPLLMSLTGAGLMACCRIVRPKGYLVFMFPGYLGFLGGDQGWMQELVANGPTRMQTYGAWIATRYREPKKSGLDDGRRHGMTSTQRRPMSENALLTGLKSVAGQQSTLFSAEWGSNQSLATDQTTFGSQMTLNGVYRHGGDVNADGRRGYSSQPNSACIPARGSL